MDNWVRDGGLQANAHVVGSGHGSVDHCECTNTIAASRVCVPIVEALGYFIRGNTILLQYIRKALPKW